MLHAVADGVRLEKLGAVEQLVKILRVQIGLGDIVHNFAVGGSIPLVHLHHPGVNVPVALIRKPADCLQGREGLEAELREETVVMLPVCGKGLVAVPYAPVVDVSHVFGVAVFIVAARGRGRGPVESVRVFFFYKLRNYVLIQADIVIVLLFGLRPGQGLVLGFHLVITAPQTDTGMGAETADILTDFRADIGFKDVLELIGGAGEHEILPYDKPSLVAHVVKEVVQEIAAAPDAQAVIVGFLSGSKQHVGTSAVLPCKDIVLGNIIRAHGKNLQAVYFVRKIAPGNLLFLSVGDNDAFFSVG